MSDILARCNMEFYIAARAHLDDLFLKQIRILSIYDAFRGILADF